MSITSFIGPFPTDYAIPSDCDNISSNSIAGFDFKSSCLPEDFDGDPTAYYSPGTVCPGGYTAREDCTRTGGATTTVTCCPVRGDIELWCVSDPGSLEGPWESMYCTWSAGDEATVLLVTSDSSTMGVTMSGGQGINAYGLKMVYESSDLETSTSTPSETSEPTTEAAATTGPSETAAEQSASSTTSASTDDDGGLSTAAITAIAVVIPVVLLALGIGLFLFIRRRKQQASAIHEIANHEPKHYPDGSATVSTSGATGYSSPHSGTGAIHGPIGVNTGAAVRHNPHSNELYGDMAHSPYQASPPQELSGESYVAELPAGSPPPPPSKSPSFNVAVGTTPSPLSDTGKGQGYYHRG